MGTVLEHMDLAHVLWCRALFDSLADRGVWGIPRSGLVFQRRGSHELRLIAVMPHDDDMPVTAVELAEQQSSDYAATRDHFHAAGIEVTADAATLTQIGASRES